MLFNVTATNQATREISPETRKAKQILNLPTFFVQLGTVGQSEQLTAFMNPFLRISKFLFAALLIPASAHADSRFDSDVTFASYITASFYPKDKTQLEKYQKPKGIERKLVPNQLIKLDHTPERGGILTMPGILAMNRGPILRGTWMLRRILGERLGDPPADIPPIEASAPNEDITFRERFELHRSDPTCARCHDKIDPLGFAMQLYDDSGAYKLASSYKAPRRKKEHDDAPDDLNTSGQMPSGETFANYEELKAILLGPKRRAIIRNAVEQTLAYALARKLEVFDRPTVDAIAETIDETNGTWRNLFKLIAQSLPFLNLMEGKSQTFAKALSQTPSSDGPPLRFLTLFKPNGVHPPSWNINGGTEFDFRPSPLMAPFAKHKDDLLFLDNMGDFGFSSHANSTRRFLSGHHENQDSASVDQVIAEKIGCDTAHRSIELTTEGLFTGQFGCSYISYDKDGGAMPRESDPQLVFDRLFRNPMSDASQRQRMSSLLDRVNEDAKALSRKAGYLDQQTLDQYLTAVRETERRLETLASSCGYHNTQLRGYP